VRTTLQHRHAANADQPGALLDLALGFRSAAARARPRRGSTLLRAPFELLCLHSVDLALGAALLASEFDAPTVRAMGNDVPRRARALQLQNIGWAPATLATIEALARAPLSSAPPLVPADDRRIALARIDAMVDDTIDKCTVFVARCEAAAQSFSASHERRYARRA
jgi:hypothetical protein